MYLFCNTHFILYLSLALNRNVAAYNITLLGSAKSSNSLAFSQNSLNSSSTAISNTISLNPSSSNLLSLSSLWSSSPSFSSFTSSTISSTPPWSNFYPSDSLWLDGQLPSVPFIGALTPKLGPLGTSVSPSHTVPPLVGASAVSGSSLTVHGLRPTNATVPPSTTAPPTPLPNFMGPQVLSSAAALEPPSVTVASDPERQRSLPPVETSDPSPTVPQPNPKFPANDPAKNLNVAQNQGGNNPAAVSPAPPANPNNESPTFMSQLHQALTPTETPQKHPKAASDPVRAPNHQPNLQPEEAGFTAPLPSPQQPQPTIAPEPHTKPGPQPGAGGSAPGSSENAPPVQNSVGGQSDQGAGESEGLSSPPDNNQNTPGAASEDHPTQVDLDKGDSTADGNLANKPIILSPVQLSRNAQSADGAAPALPAAQPLPKLGGQPILQSPDSDLVIAGSTLPPGSQATVAGHTVSNGASHVVVDRKTHALEPPTAPSPRPAPAVAAVGDPIPSIGGQPILQNTNSDLIIGGSTLPPGSQATVAGHSVSNDATKVVVDGKTQVLQPPTAPSLVPAPAVAAPKQPLPSIGGQPILQEANSNLIVAGNTVLAGSQAVVVGHTVSNGASNVVIDSSTYALQPPSIVTPAPALPSVEGHQVVQNSNSDLVVAGSTIAPGHQAIMAGHTVSNAVSHIVLDSNTQALPPLPVAPPLLSNNQIVQASSGALQLGDQTILPGSQATVSGHMVKYVNPSQVIVDGTSLALSPVQTSNPLVIGGQTVHRAPDGGLILGSLTMAPNAQATLSGQVYSLEGSSSVIVDGSAYSLPPTENAYVVQIMPTNTESSGPITLANGLIVTPVTSADKPGANPALDLPNGAVISAGGPSAVVSGTTYSVLPSNYGLLVNDTSTLTLPPRPSPSFFTVDGKIFTAASNGFSLAGGTILPSGAAVTVSGVDVRLGTNSALHIGSATLATSGPASTNGVGGPILAAFKAPAGDQKAAATRKEACGFGLAGALGAGIGTLVYLI